MRKYFLFMGLLAATATATATATAEVPFDYELRFGTSHLGYSNFDGFHYGLGLSFAKSFDENWQWQVGGSVSSRAHYSDIYRFSVNTGARYNFGEDMTRAFFVGVGAEWGDQYSLGSRAYEKGVAGYVEFGKRFRLNESGSFAYTPFMTATSRGEGAAILRLEPISFSYSF